MWFELVSSSSATMAPSRSIAAVKFCCSCLVALSMIPAAACLYAAENSASCRYARKVLSPIPAAFAASALVRHTRRACSAFSLRGVNISPLSIGVFCGFLAVIEPHKVRKVHCYAPRLTAAAMEHNRHTVTKALAVRLCLLHPLGKPDLLAAFDLDMNAGQAHKVGHFTEGHRPAAFHDVTILSKNGGKLSFTVCAFSL